MSAVWRRALPAALVLLGGCGLLPSTPSFQGDSVELSQTPFFPQEQHQCGPAALATVLVADGVEITPEALSSQVFIPDRKGSLQAELLAAARRQDRVPLAVRPELPALHEALTAGEPVLLLQNLGLRKWPRWHYAVVIGFDADANRFLLRSGREHRESLSASRLLSSWERARRWAVVMTPPDAIPAFARAAEWIAAAAPFESLGRMEIAARAYEAAVARWSDSALSWQALANVRYAQNRRLEAESALRRAVELEPGAVAARNNLANLLLERGCVSAARRELDAITEIPPAVAADVIDTRGSLMRRTQEDAADCPSEGM